MNITGMLYMANDRFSFVLVCNVIKLKYMRLATENITAPIFIIRLSCLISFLSLHHSTNGVMIGNQRS